MLLSIAFYSSAVYIKNKVNIHAKAPYKYQKSDKADISTVYHLNRSSELHVDFVFENCSDKPIEYNMREQENIPTGMRYKLYTIDNKLIAKKLAFREDSVQRKPRSMVLKPGYGRLCDIKLKDAYRTLVPGRYILKLSYDNRNPHNSSPITFNKSLYIVVE